MSNDALTSRLLSNPHKSHTLTTPQIAATIYELSKNSAFTQNQAVRQQKLDKRIAEIKEMEKRKPWGKREKEYVDNMEQKLEGKRDMTQVVVHVRNDMNIRCTEWEKLIPRK